jgi:putative molybdopterin biosynthesis protein
MRLMADTTMYTVEEIAKMLKVSTETIRKLIARGEIKAKRIGKQYRVTQEALDEYLDKQ